MTSLHEVHEVVTIDTTTVQDVNRRAVQLVREGSFEEAVSLLDQAFGYIRSTLHQNDSLSDVPTHSAASDGVDDADDGESTVRDSSSSSRNSECINESHTSSSHKVPTGRHDVLQEVRGSDPSRNCTIRSVSIAASPIQSGLYIAAVNIFEFYPRAFVFDLEQGSSNNDVVTKEAQLCVVIYNMGVCYHSEAIRLQQYPFPDRPHEHYYAYALRLYNVAQLYLHEGWAMLNQEDENMALLLALALSNNSGHIHAHCGNFREMRYSLDAIQHFMHSIPESGSSSPDEQRVLSWYDQSFFARTATLFEDRNLNIAPSA